MEETKRVEAAVDWEELARENDRRSDLDSRKGKDRTRDDEGGRAKENEREGGREGEKKRWKGTRQS